MNDLKYTHGSDVLAVKACYNVDANDLIAVAGEDTVEVLQCTQVGVRQLACFNIGLRVTAMTWSSRSVSPSVSDEWLLELAISTHDYRLHILSMSYETEEETIFKFGGGLTGHHGRINDIAYVGGRDDHARHLASVSDDNNLIIWDLRPGPSSETYTPQPKALVIPFSSALCSVSAHASTSKEFVISDAKGSVFLVDWRKDPDMMSDESASRQSIVELVHPRVVGDAACSILKQLHGCASWRADDAKMIGATFGSEYALWDLNELKGGKPFATATSFAEGGHRFRWCPTSGEYFAMSPLGVTPGGAVIKVMSVYHLGSQTSTIQIAPKPHKVSDFDWVASRGVPRLAVAVGRDVYIFPISVE